MLSLSINFDLSKLSKSPSVVVAIFAQSFTNFWNCSFLETKSVSEFISIKHAWLLCIWTPTKPWAATLPLFFAATDKPFFLSGGLSLDNLNNLNMINDNEMLYGLDLNSKFEKYPGLKDVEKIGKLFNLNLWNIM